MTLTISRYIRRARKAQNLTQKQLGDKIGVTKSFISKIESGAHPYSVRTLESLLEVLGLNFKIEKSNTKNVLN